MDRVCLNNVRDLDSNVWFPGWSFSPKRCKIKTRSTSWRPSWLTERRSAKISSKSWKTAENRHQLLPRTCSKTAASSCQPSCFIRATRKRRALMTRNQTDSDHHRQQWATTSPTRSKQWTPCLPGIYAQTITGQDAESSSFTDLVLNLIIGTPCEGPRAQTVA